MVINKQKWLNMFELPEIKAEEDNELRLRTLYGNIYHVGGETIRDVKYHSTHQRLDKSLSFVSTNNTSFKRDEVGGWIRNMFREPSEYEV
jgi:hypothetical protein